MNNTLRQQYLDSLRTQGKQLIAKSANAPDVLTIRGPNGEVLGFGKPEHVPQQEVEYLKCVSDPNAVFDTLLPNAGTSRIEAHKSNVQKSASDTTDPNGFSIVRPRFRSLKSASQHRPMVASY
jgi:hypothetical protein